jgi:uncharacterized protein DUF1629
MSASNSNPAHSPLPPDALELLEDPRLDGMTNPHDKFRKSTRVLQPEQLERNPSVYLSMREGYGADPTRNARWVNEPEWFFLDGGRGAGFGRLTERPRFEQAGKAPKRLFHLWRWGGHYVASPDMVDLLSKEDPASIVTLPIDWVFSDGQCLDGYVFLDVVRLHYAYDYKRSVVNVEMKDGRKYPHLGNDRALRTDIPEGLKIFRDAHHRHDVFVSRPLAAEINALASRELAFNDVHTHHSVQFPRSKARRKLQARLRAAEVVVENESMPLERRLSLRVLPLLQDNAFVEAEAVLKQWLQALPSSAYHVVTDLEVTTTPQACATFFDDFCNKAASEHRVKAVYAEMNAFAVNPGLWFCDAFGFRKDGGREGYDWLGEMDSWTDERLVITGLEPLQSVFAADSMPQEHRTARQLTEFIVIVKFQRLLQQSLPYMSKLACPLLASAHDYNDFIVEIRSQ